LDNEVNERLIEITVVKLVKPPVINTEAYFEHEFTSTLEQELSLKKQRQYLKPKLNTPSNTCTALKAKILNNLQRNRELLRKIKEMKDNVRANASQLAKYSDEPIDPEFTIELLKAHLLKENKKYATLKETVEEHQESKDKKQKIYVKELKGLVSSIEQLKESYYSKYDLKEVPNKTKQLKTTLDSLKADLSSMSNEDKMEIKQLKQIIALNKNKLREQQLVIHT
jgi:chromosome segregation ATPase